MATGSGKTIMAVTALYRLIKFGGARRVLFLVDRQNLAEQAEREFQGYRTPDDNRKFTDLYKVQRLTTNTISSSTKVVITTVQRLYSMLKGEPDLPPEQEDGSAFDHEDMLPKEPLPVVYNAAISPEYFDVIVIDECHRSIYSLWRQVLDYFDAYLVGLTATPAKHTYGFFNQNLVMEYPHERAVADRVNVDFEVYKIRTKITELGSTIEKTNTVDIRDRGTTQQRWLKDDVVYTGNDLDRSVVATDQIRLIARTYRDRLPTELFPGRKEVPKTLVFAKDDQHAEDIVEVLRQEFGEGNAFCQKITYKTTGAKTADLIQAFRNEFNPRIAVTVDMIATGTDIRPIEVVIFLREVKSRVLFEQMKGRGVRVIDPNELRSVTPSASAKTHFLVIDCVGVTEGDLPDTQPLERKKTVPFKSLLEHVASGGTDPDVLSSLASRLARLDKVLLPAESKKVHEAAGASLASITATLVAALDPDQHAAKARQVFGLPDDADPTVAQKTEAANVLMKEAVLPLVTLPDLRKLLVALKTSHEQIIDHVSKDELLHDKTGFSKEAKDKAMQTAIAFETWLTDSKDEIDALQFFFSVPHRDRLRFADIKALAEAIHKPPRSWTPEALWRAYETLDQKKVKGAGGQRMLTDVVSLVRFALHQDGELVPYAERVRDRFDNWIAQQENGGRRFTDHQVRWLEMMRDHIAGSAEIGVDDFDATPFAQAGGLWRARELFGAELHGVLRDLNEAVAA
jgi:type I restriction enzyme R subunit